MIQRNGDKRNRDAPRFGFAGLIRGLTDALTYILHVRDVDIFIGISIRVLSLKHDCVPARPPPPFPSFPLVEWIKYFFLVCISVLVVARLFLPHRPRTVPSLLRGRPALREWSMPRLLLIVRTDGLSRVLEIRQERSLLFPQPGARNIIRSKSRGITRRRRNATKYRRLREEAH